MEVYFLTAIAASFLFILFLWRRNNPDQVVRTSLLSLYSRDLTQLAKGGKLDPLIGRHHEIARLVQTLSRRTKNNPVLIGNSGVGKTAIVEELANLISSGNVPSSLAGKRVLQLDLSGLVAGTKYRGEFEKRLKGVVSEIVAAQRKIILFIDELHSLAEAGEATGAINAADILKPALARGELQAIGATTLDEYRNSIESDETLKRRFQPIFVDEPSVDETMKILQGLRRRYESYHEVRIADAALKKAVQLAAAHLTDRMFPDKAIDIIDEAAARVHLNVMTNAPKSERPEVQERDVEAVVQEWLKDAAQYRLARDHKQA